MKFRIFIFFLLHFVGGNSQELPPPPISGITDVHVSGSGQYNTDSLLLQKPTTNNIVFPKSFDPKFRSKYKGADYDYTTVKPRESLWQKIKKRIMKILESIFGKVDPTKSGKYAENIMRIFAVIIIGFVIYFLIKFLLGKDGNFLFSKKNKKINITNQDLQENIHEINFSQSIEKFEKRKDYRSAVRYQFLLVLKKLADKDYLFELKTDDLKTDFKELTYIFDYVWYGEFDVTEENYSNFKQKFLNFKI